MSNNKKNKILVVDDIVENIDLIVNLLKSTYQVMAATSGLKALKIAQSKNQPDLILLDVMMPEMDGYEVIQNLKANPNTKNIPVIFITAKGEVKDEAKGFELGAADYIIKPINPYLLKARVKTHIELYNHQKNLMQLVEDKSKELVTLNRELEQKVFEKTEENLSKSHIIVEQMRFAQMGELLQMIAHQWRQPLNVITLHIEAIKFFLNDGDYEEIEKYIDKSVEAVMSLSKTINMFSDYFKPINKIEKIKLNDFLYQTIDLVKEIFYEQNISFELSLKEEIEIITYSKELREVIIKLIQNSKEAFKKQNIQNPKIIIQTFKDENSFTIQIEDNGGGIKEEILTKIFDPYFSTKAELQKYGLGLYIAKTVIETHCKGELKVENFKDGVIVKINLPKSLNSK